MCRYKPSPGDRGLISFKMGAEEFSHTGSGRPFIYLGEDLHGNTGLESYLLK